MHSSLLHCAAETLYDALGVSQEASDRDIKRAYRQKALKLHPDVNKQACLKLPAPATSIFYRVLSLEAGSSRAQRGDTAA